MSIPSIVNTQTTGVQTAIANTLGESSLIANKISTGKGILYAYEDPAGLAIGTQLETNVSILKEALKSAHQASTVLNIGYGGLEGVTNVLKRLNVLSIMALNGSATDQQRRLIDLEAQQLKSEINRISDATRFNGKVLLNGSLDIGEVKAANGFEFTFETIGSDTNDVKDQNGNTVLKYVPATTGSSATTATLKVNKFTLASAITGPSPLAAGDYITTTGAPPTSASEALYRVDGANIQSVVGAKIYFTVDSATDITKVTDGATNPADVFTFDKTSTEVKNAKGIVVQNFGDPSEVTTGMTFQVGVEASQKIKIGFDSVRTAALGIDSINLKTIKDATKAQESIVAALDIMSKNSSTTGAYQSRFNMVANSLATAIENTDAARSQFLDADFTELTKEFSQNQAKLRASIAAEAKMIQTPQILLELIRSI